jgi:nucleotide-binding universal stress UspA family protein
MFRNVLIGVDGSPTGRDAIALASALVDPGGRVTFAHVRVAFHASGRPFHGAPGAGGAADGEPAAGLLETERRAAGVRAELVEVSESSVGRGLHGLAEELEADLLVLGSCSHGPVGRTLVGDDTRASLNGAPCAVAVAPRGYATHPQALTAVGVGCDFSDASHAAVAVGREIAARHGATLVGLHVLAQPIGAYAAPMPADWGEILERDRKAAEDRLAAIEGIDGSAVYGIPGQELEAFGDRVNLLVVGSRSYGPVRRLMFGSTSNGLARHARCPLLVLPRAITISATDGSRRAAREQAPVGATA